MLLLLHRGPWRAVSAPFAPERRFRIGCFPTNESCRTTARGAFARSRPAPQRSARMLSRMSSFFTAVALVIATATPLTGALAQESTITVFAAASMKNALDDINAAFTKSTGSKVVASYAASSALIKQIENGAPADVFASADL